MPIFTSRIYIYNIYHCQECIFVSIYRYLDEKLEGNQFNYKLSKQGLGCAIYMKEYRIMMYLLNQIYGLITNHFIILIS